jgi:hypothetical protein
MRTWAMMAVAALAAGCGPSTELGWVEGTVRVGNRPLDNARVSFFPDPDKGTPGRLSSAVTDAEGRYRLVYADDPTRDGASVGWHRVLVEDLNAEDRDRPRAERRPRADLKFASSSATPLRYEVRPGPQTIDLTVTPPAR